MALMRSRASSGALDPVDVDSVTRGLAIRDGTMTVKRTRIVSIGIGAPECLPATCPRGLTVEKGKR